jgi:hypothetical protein
VRTSRRCTAFHDHLPVISQLPPAAPALPAGLDAVVGRLVGLAVAVLDLALEPERLGPATLSTTICTKRRANGLFCAAWRERARRMRSWKRSVVLMNCVSACRLAVRRESCARVVAAGARARGFT